MPLIPMTPTIRAPQKEAKFALAEARAGAALALLRQQCRPDAEHPANVVSSLYYDTRDRRGLYGKLNSDFLKTKFRLRWYRDLDGRFSTPGSFFEVKQRIGGTRHKRRIAAPFDASWLDEASPGEPALARITELLRSHGVHAPPLVPVFVIRYERHRFLEPSSGLRVNLDRRITVTSSHPHVTGPRFRVALTQAVLEVKGARAEELPRPLWPALRLGCRLGSFSKYATCYAAALGAPR